MRREQILWRERLKTVSSIVDLRMRIFRPLQTIRISKGKKIKLLLPHRQKKDGVPINQLALTWLPSILVEWNYL